MHPAAQMPSAPVDGVVELDAFSASGACGRRVAPLLQPHLARAPETHRLQPTDRSALGA